MAISWQTLLAIGTGGFLGAISRAYAIHFANKHVPLEFPVGVLLVNVIGSFVIGILFAVFAHFTFSESIKAFLTTGFLGALTTYSTFAIESFFLLQNSIFLGITNMVLNLFGTILAAASGYKLIHFFLK
ncbi:fluoride efflux transporter CrcB [Halarcobacter anaerophilus]|uniref:Fluoride-specific ion channel FluC n=1 Tax=Halarcobacter anaerophilus TaxID=877500 RepID=A0A4Q0Y362_9BACT|nr:fluoride efflux transporter CrcB [Halarcobacter anaerophilus]QDF27855.1 putative fluoride ion transporter [Halarcobacter anaerophilus]RXJ64193.1 fluoride efflux transporter CrcB [Halarcobacter anaerophilus]